MSVELKVYGHIYPASSSLENDLRQAVQTAIQDTISLDVPLVERENDLLRISFEGLYFPVEDVLEVITKYIIDFSFINLPVFCAPVLTASAVSSATSCAFIEIFSITCSVLVCCTTTSSAIAIASSPVAITYLLMYSRHGRSCWITKTKQYKLLLET